MICRCIALLCLATCLCTCAPAPSETSAVVTPMFDTAADKAAVEQLIQDIFDDIWSGTDTANVRRYQLPEFVLLEHGEVWTNDTIRNWQLGKLAEKTDDTPRRLNSFEFFRNEQNGDEIWVAYHNTAHFINAESDTLFTGGWLESAVAARTEDGWKLRMMHSTRKPRRR